MNIFRFNASGYIRLRLLKGPVFFVLSIVCFFVVYNSFLVDRSIESLKLSLYSISSAESASSSVSHVAPLVQVQYIDELSSSSSSSEDLINLGYTSDILEASSTGRKVKDAAALMEEVIRRKESERKSLLKFLDRLNDLIKNIFRKMPTFKKSKIFVSPNIDSAILNKINEYEHKGDFNEAIGLYRETISSFINYAQTPALILRLGYLLHKLGRFKEAEALYEDIARKFPDAPENEVAKELIDILRRRSLVKEEAVELLSMIEKTNDKQTLQRLYYNLGSIELSALNLNESRESFNKAISMLADTQTAQKAYLRVGVCDRLLGELDESLESFKKLADITTDETLKIQSQHQSAQVYYQKGDYEKTISSLESIIKTCNDKSLIPLLLFQLGSTYLYDAKNPAKAKEIFEELRMKFPGNALVYPGTYFVEDEVQLDALPEIPSEIDMLINRSWLEKALPKDTLKLLEDKSLMVASRITEIAQYTLSEEKNMAKVEITQERASSLLRKLDEEEDSSKGQNQNAGWCSSVDYTPDAQKITIYGNLVLPGGNKAKSSLSGTLKMVGMVDNPHWAGGKRRRNYIIFTTDECKIGNVRIPKNIMNAILRASLEKFNNNFPLDIKKFYMTKQAIIIMGTIKQDSLKRKISSADYGQGEKKESIR